MITPARLSALETKPAAAIDVPLSDEELAELVRVYRSRDRLLQVAVEAIRLVHGAVLGDHYSHEPCGDCGLGGAGALRYALTAALGSGYTRLVWGKDMNADFEKLRTASVNQDPPTPAVRGTP
jgi:hypothetical protein